MNLFTKTSKTIAAIGLALSLLSGMALAGCSSASGEGIFVGERAPDFQLPDLDGNTVSLSDLRGKPILLNFWAISCPYCRSEMSYIQQVHDEWSDKGLVVIGVNNGESRPAVIEFLEKYHLTFPVLLDTRETVVEQYRILHIPATLFIDKDGIIQVKITSAFPSKEAIESKLSKIMPE